MGTAEQMNVILVHPNRFHLDRKSLRDFSRRLTLAPFRDNS